MLTQEQISQVRESFNVYQNTGTVSTGKWVYQPHDFDSSFELWSDTYATEAEALESALKEMQTA